MKHLFFVHSHITWLVSLGVMEKEGIPAESALFVTFRGYTIPDPSFRCVPFTISDKKISSRNPLVRLREAVALRRLIQQLVKNEDFFWYFPQTSYTFFPHLIQHRQCRGFSVIEEGTGSYHCKGDIDALLNRSRQNGSWLARIRSAVFPPPKIEFVDSRYRRVYGCSADAFPGYPRKVTIQLPRVQKDSQAPIQAVIAFDAVLEYGWANPTAFYQCTDQLLAHLAASGHRRVHYKFHPAQYLDPRFSSVLKEQLTNNSHLLETVELPSDVALEQIATGGTTEFYIFVSSVGIYASMFGCRVYSMSKRLSKLDATYGQVFASVPERVKSRFEYL